MSEIFNWENLSYMYKTYSNVYGGKSLAKTMNIENIEMFCFIMMWQDIQIVHGLW